MQVTAFANTLAPEGNYDTEVSFNVYLHHWTSVSGIKESCLFICQTDNSLVVLPP